MQLSTLRTREMGKRERVILDTLWDVVNGEYPHIEGLTDQECKDLFEGKKVKDIANPFLALAPDMQVAKLKPMLLRTTHDVAVRDRQLAVHHMYNNINHMLALLECVVEHLEMEDIASNVF